MTAVEWLDRVESTNAELVRREREAAQPHFTVLATLDQTGGRGRLGRTWSAAPGAALAVSVLIRPQLIPPDRLGLLTLLAGLAAHRAVAALVPDRDVSVKWPNDVLVGGSKIAGVLAEVEPRTGGVIIGIGLNTAMTAAQRPVETATSIAIETGSVLPPRELADRVLAVLLDSLAGLVDRFETARGDIDLGGMRAELELACGTLGQRVAVQLPDETTLAGRALALGVDGSLVVRVDGSERPTAILAGDVTHLRYQ